ncbi:MAG: endonuclease/exonuclease/phosphatase family protein [Pseudomonadota bacterium]
MPRSALRVARRLVNTGLAACAAISLWACSQHAVGPSTTAVPALAGSATPAVRPAGAVRLRLRLMTFNILWEGYQQDGEYVASGFSQRKPMILEVLRRHGADVVGLQEASQGQRIQLATDLPGFGMFPLPQAPGDECILYRADRFAVMESGHEILRRLPEREGTNVGVRDFVWVNLRERSSGRQFYVLNLHADDRSSERGRELDGVLLGQWIQSRRVADPVVLLGDFNGRYDQPRLQFLTGRRDYPDAQGGIATMPMPMIDTLTAVNPAAEAAGSPDSGYGDISSRGQIDYILVPRGTRVIESRILYDHMNGIYPSDHFPLSAEVELE